MRLIAVDPATNAGICEGAVGGTPTLITWKLRRSREDEPEDIFGLATRLFADLVRASRPDAIAVEVPVRVKRDGKTNDKTTTLTRGLYGIFTGITKANGILLLPAEIKTWRAYALDNGNLDGAAAKRACLVRCKQLGWPAPTHDAAEAAGIFLWASGQLSSPLLGRVA